MKLIGLISRTQRFVSKHGFKHTILTVKDSVEDFFFDILHGTDTRGRMDVKQLASSEEFLAHASGYQTTQSKAFVKLLNELSLPKNLGFMDFGCGKGRMLLLAVSYGFKPVKGVEFSEFLCKKANLNTTRYVRFVSGAKHIHIHEGDAAYYIPQADENIFYFSNPFDDIVLTKVFANIEKSISLYPRPICIIYRNPVYARVFENVPLLSYRIEYRISSSVFVLYANDLFQRNYLIGHGP